MNGTRRVDAVSYDTNDLRAVFAHLNGRAHHFPDECRKIALRGAFVVLRGGNHQSGGFRSLPPLAEEWIAPVRVCLPKDCFGSAWRCRHLYDFEGTGYALLVLCPVCASV